ncbi:MAG: CAP domain-containing protein [Paracoccus sp. (in: a-proteobacteria)]|uniref:CAP domain-containing protein n=1 Tax=Paracoccus sp. TaxID=267 RepID=UPI0026DF0C96|nr:CAP domain-containing protein [Paracoccus sp. (in: a-proteobacteria)]MDO5621508.1 CAP domain-containing protein [Paracoccus sp. (in: a-proteobacteria)]
MTLTRLFALGFTLILTACGQGSSPADGTSPYDVQAAAPGQAQCFTTSAADNAKGAAATSAVRRAQGQVPVRANDVLARAAAAHACDMAKRGFMSHAGSTTTGPRPRAKALGFSPQIIAENIAAGPFSLDRVLAEWNASSGHLSNILIPQMTDFGIGRAIGSDGRTVFWAAVYSTPG